MKKTYMPRTAIETKIRLSLSRLELAREEIGSLVRDGIIDADGLLDQVDNVIDVYRVLQKKASEEYGFTIRGGIGPGDWKDK